MTNPTDLIERLTELDGKRTPGEWSYIGEEHDDFVIFAGDEYVTNIGNTRLSSLELKEGAVAFDVNDQANALFITTLANEALPALEAMKAEIERLREALKPFAKLDQRGDPFSWKDDRPVYGRNNTQVTTEDFRRARQALGDSHD